MRKEQQRNTTILSLALLALLPTALPAAWVTLGSGGTATTGTFPDRDVFGISPIPDDQSTISSTINVSGFSGTLQGPQILRVRLIGLTHDAAGDLQIIIRNVTAGIQNTVISQLGISSPGDALINFDNGAGGLSGFYQFYPSAPFNLWVEMPLLYPGNGDTDIIPSDFAYLPTDSSGTALTWANFASLSPNGEWRLEITDLAAQYSGSIIGWEIDMWVPDVPEPSTYAMAAGALGWLLLRRRAR